MLGTECSVSLATLLLLADVLCTVGNLKQGSHGGEAKSVWHSGGICLL